MLQQDYIDHITERLKNCTDESLLDLILELLMKSGY